MIPSVYMKMPGEIDEPLSSPVMDVVLTFPYKTECLYKCKGFFDFRSHYTRVPRDAKDILEGLVVADRKVFYEEHLSEKEGLQEIVPVLQQIYNADLYLCSPETGCLYEEPFRAEIILHDSPYVFIGRNVLMHLFLGFSGLNSRWVYDDGERIERYGQGVKFAERITNGIAKTFCQLGSFQFYFGDYESAAASYQKSEELENRNNKKGLSIIYRQKGVLFCAQGCDEEAKKMFSESYRLAKEEGDLYGVALTLVQWGRFYQERNKLGEAEQCYREAQNILENLVGRYLTVVGRYRNCVAAQEKLLARGGLYEERTFVDIDIVEYSTMVEEARKKGTHGQDIQDTVNAFHRFWVERVKSRGGKMFREPEGDRGIFLFETSDSAVEAVIEILRMLDEFNADTNRNKIGMPFRIRIGICAGHIPIEKIADGGTAVFEPLNFAAHLQNVAKPNQVLICGGTLKRLKRKRGFQKYEPSEEIVKEQHHSWDKIRKRKVAVYELILEEILLR